MFRIRGTNTNCTTTCSFYWIKEYIFFIANCVLAAPGIRAMMMESLQAAAIFIFFTHNMLSPNEINFFVGCVGFLYDVLQITFAWMIRFKAAHQSSLEFTLEVELTQILDWQIWIVGICFWKRQKPPTEFVHRIFLLGKSLGMALIWLFHHQLFRSL